MTVAVGWSGFFSLDNAAGSPIDLTPYVTSVSLELDKQVFDVTVFGNTGSRAKVTGLKDGKFSVTFFNDPVVQTHLVGLWGVASGTTHTFVYGPQGSTGGGTFRRITGECIMPKLGIAAVVDDVERLPTEFECTATITLDFFP
jgi:hypothetical protein